MPEYAIGYGISPTVVDSTGAVAPDKAVLYWDATSHVIRGSTNLTFNASTLKLTLGTGTQLLLPDGVVGTPVIARSSATQSGIYFTADAMRMAILGNQVGYIANSGIGILDTGSYSFFAGDVKLTRPGAGQLSLSTGSQFLLPDGSAAAPSISFGSATNLGIFRGGTNDLRISVGNSADYVFQPGKLILNGADVTLQFNADTILRRDGAANVLAQRNGANAQEFRVYNTFTSATNYERFDARWSGNVLFLGAEKGSAGGTQRAVVMGGLLGTDNSFAVRAGSAQSANLQEWQNSSGTPLAYLDPSFGIYAHGDISNIKYAAPNAGERSSAQSLTNIIGSLAVTGAIQADSIVCRQVYNLEGTPYACAHGSTTDIAFTQASAVQNQWYTITSANIVSGLINPRLSHSQGTITLESNAKTAGIYLIGYDLSVEASVANKHIEIAIAINGTQVTDGQNRVHLSVSGVEESISGRAILAIPSAGTIALSFRTPDTGTPDITVRSYQLTAHKIAG